MASARHGTRRALEASFAWIAFGFEPSGCRFSGSDSFNMGLGLDIQLINGATRAWQLAQNTGVSRGYQ